MAMTLEQVRDELSILANYPDLDYANASVVSVNLLIDLRDAIDAHLCVQAKTDQDAVDRFVEDYTRHTGRGGLFLDGVQFALESFAARLSYGVQGEAVAWAIKWPRDDRINLSTVFDTKDEASDYSEKCGSNTKIVPLYTHPTERSDIQKQV